MEGTCQEEGNSVSLCCPECLLSRERASTGQCPGYENSSLHSFSLSEQRGFGGVPTAAHMLHTSPTPPTPSSPETQRKRKQTGWLAELEIPPRDVRGHPIMT